MVSRKDNEFHNAIGSIRKYFDWFFDVKAIQGNHGKCFSIEIMDKDRYGNSRYGIELDTNDFDLGWYSIHKNNI